MSRFFFWNKYIENKIEVSVFENTIFWIFPPNC